MATIVMGTMNPAASSRLTGSIVATTRARLLITRDSIRHPHRIGEVESPLLLCAYSQL